MRGFQVAVWMSAFLLLGCDGAVPTDTNKPKTPVNLDNAPWVELALAKPVASYSQYESGVVHVYTDRDASCYSLQVQIDYVDEQFPSYQTWLDAYSLPGVTGPDANGHVQKTFLFDLRDSIPEGAYKLTFWITHNDPDGYYVDGKGDIIECPVNGEYSQQAIEVPIELVAGSAVADPKAYLAAELNTAITEMVSIDTAGDTMLQLQLDQLTSQMNQQLTALDGYDISEMARVANYMANNQDPDMFGANVFGATYMTQSLCGYTFPAALSAKIVLAGAAFAWGTFSSASGVGAIVALAGAYKLIKYLIEFKQHYDGNIENIYNCLVAIEVQEQTSDTDPNDISNLLDGYGGTTDQASKVVYGYTATSTAGAPMAFVDGVSKHIYLKHVGYASSETSSFLGDVKSGVEKVKWLVEQGGIGIYDKLFKDILAISPVSRTTYLVDTASYTVTVSDPRIVGSIGFDGIQAYVSFTPDAGYTIPVGESWSFDFTISTPAGDASAVTAVLHNSDYLPLPEASPRTIKFHGCIGTNTVDMNVPYVESAELITDAQNGHVSLGVSGSDVRVTYSHQVKEDLVYGNSGPVNDYFIYRAHNASGSSSVTRVELVFDGIDPVYYPFEPASLFGLDGSYRDELPVTAFMPAHYQPSISYNYYYNEGADSLRFNVCNKITGSCFREWHGGLNPYWNEPGLSLQLTLFDAQFHTINHYHDGWQEYRDAKMTIDDQQYIFSNLNYQTGVLGPIYDAIKYYSIRQTVSACDHSYAIVY
jgi:hypothetical protein